MRLTTRSSTTRVAGLAAALAVTPLAVLASAAPSAQGLAPDQPTLHLFSADTALETTRPKGGMVFLNAPTYLHAVDGDLDIRIRREDYASPVTITQVVDGGTVDLGELDIRNWRAFGAFSHVTVAGPAGRTVVDKDQRFCPNGYSQQRVDPEGADESTFPSGCSGMPFTLGSVWGVDQGWATPLSNTWRGLRFRGPDGRYTVTTTVNEPYRSALGMSEGEATSTITLDVATGAYEFHRPVRAERPADPGAPRRAIPIDTDPAAETLPDLQTLPAFGIGTQSRRGKDFLAFGANVWVGGDALLDVEGFRRADEDVMDAYQYFYADGEPVGRAAVGTMDYDTRRGHHHWHLLQFADYRLLQADRETVATSKKQSFCIVPTDPVDLSLDNAERRPWQTGLGSACGERDALWIRETLPVGWGDTYFQSRGGQDFNITDLPNGRYFISITANPTGELYESDTTNNETSRLVILKGRPGARRACVPAVHGIDPEGDCPTIAGR